jgi:hypothetical protein
VEVPYVTQTDMFHAAILSNFLYGLLLLARAPGRFDTRTLSALWVTATGAIGHFCYASMMPEQEAPDAPSALLLMLDIVLVFTSLWVATLTFPWIAHLLADWAGGLMGI